MNNLALSKQYEITVVIREVNMPEVDMDTPVEPERTFVCGTVGGVQIAVHEFAIARDKERWIDEILKSAMAKSRPRLITKLVLNLREALNGGENRG
jgi:hypothetical protein